jgi:hypothetical protein
MVVEMDSYSSGEGPVVVSCARGNEHSNSIKRRGVELCDFVID